jgi:hypothetical protein
VHDDVELSRTIYGWVADLCVSLGAQADDLVPFEKYAAAAASLKKPSSAARALFSGAARIERVDLLVQGLARQKGVSHPAIDTIVRRVDAGLLRNSQARERLAA